MEIDELQEMVYNRQTEHSEGFTDAEIKKMLKSSFPQFEMHDFMLVADDNGGQIVDGTRIMYKNEVLYAMIDLYDKQENSPVSSTKG